MKKVLYINALFNHSLYISLYFYYFRRKSFLLNYLLKTQVLRSWIISTRKQNHFFFQRFVWVQYSLILYWFFQTFGAQQVSGKETDLWARSPGFDSWPVHCVVYVGHTLYPACLSLTQAVKMSTSTAGELICDGPTSRPGGGTCHFHPLASWKPEISTGPMSYNELKWI